MQDIMTALTGLTLFVSILSVIDLSMTYYTLWLDRKIFPEKSKFKELNILAAYIMKKTNSGPLGLFIGMILSQTIIWLGIYIAVRYIDPLQAIIAVSLMIGALTTVIWIHMANIQQVRILQKEKIAKEAPNEEAKSEA